MGGDPTRPHSLTDHAGWALHGGRQAAARTPAATICAPRWNTLSKETQAAFARLVRGAQAQLLGRAGAEGAR